MSDSYAQYVQAVTTALNNVPQQMQSLLTGAVQYDGAWASPGTSFFLDDRDRTDPKEVQGKGGRIEPRELQGYRRGGFFVGDEDYFYLFEEDKVRQLIDPTSTDMVSLMAGKERKKDYDIVNGALLGTTYQSSGGVQSPALDTAKALPSAQVIAIDNRDDLHDDEKNKVVTSGSLHLTIGKLITADKILKKSHVRGQKHIAVDENAKANLLASIPATSQWYVDAKALVNGEINTFMGFTFHEFSSVDGPLPYFQDAAANDSVNYVAWLDQAVYYRERQITNVSVQKDITIKGHPTQVYYKRERAWCRRYDTGVVKIPCRKIRQLQ